MPEVLWRGKTPSGCTLHLFLAGDGSLLGAAQLLDTVLALLHVLPGALHPCVQTVLRVENQATLKLVERPGLLLSCKCRLEAHEVRWKGESGNMCT